MTHAKFIRTGNGKEPASVILAGEWMLRTSPQRLAVGFFSSQQKGESNYGKKKVRR